MVFRTNQYFEGGTVAFFYLPYASDGSSVVYAILAGLVEGVEKIELAFQAGAGPCCVHVDAVATIPMRTWIHVAATLDGTTARLYLGGGEIASYAIVEMPEVGPELSALTVGSGFPGAMRDVRIWGRALSPEEITLAAAGGTPAATNLVASWALDDGAGQQAADSGPNAIPLVLGSSTAWEPVDPHWVPESFLADGPYFDFQRKRLPSTGQAFVEGIGADPNHDGFLDLFFVGGLSCATAVCTDPYYDEGEPPPVMPPIRSNGDGTFTEDPTLVQYQFVAGGSRRYRGEFTGDSQEDVFVSDSGPEFEFCMDCPPTGLHWEEWPGGRPRLFVGNAEGGLVEETNQRMPDRVAFHHGSAVGDVDGDDDLDIYLATTDNLGVEQCESGVFFPGARCPVILINDGKGHFTEDFERLPLSVSTYRDGNGNIAGYGNALMLDVDRDSDLDLYLGPGHGGPEIELADVILINDGTGHFARAPATAMPLRPGGALNNVLQSTQADFNRDGVPDIHTSNTGGMAHYWGNGDGTFRAGASQLNVFDGLVDPGDCKPADLNRDGWPDLVCIGPRNVMFFYNLGNENFEPLPFEYDFGPTYHGSVGYVDDDELVDVLIGFWGEYQFYRQVKPYFPPNAVGVFAHGFESDETGAWSVPPP